MGERTAGLAAEFKRLNDELIATIERCSEKQWELRCVGEEWSVGVTAHHVAEYNTIESDLAQTIASGEPLPPLTWGVIHEMNARHAREFANCTKEETVELLKVSGDQAVNTIQKIDDDQLRLTAAAPWLDGAPISVQQMIEDILIVHVNEHLESIRATFGSQAQSSERES